MEQGSTMPNCNILYTTPPVGQTVNVRSGGGGTPVLFTLKRGAQVQKLDPGDGQYWHIVVSEPAKRSGYVEDTFLSPNMPSDPAPLYRQMFGDPNLQSGSTGAFVNNLQYYLNFSGATPPLAVDGDFGPKTGDAVTAFQKKYPDLTVDGIAGDQIKSKLTALYGRLW